MGKQIVQKWESSDKTETISYDIKKRGHVLKWSWANQMTKVWTKSKHRSRQI